MSQFEELLAELKAAEQENATLAKALPAEDGEDDEAIRSAAEEGDADNDDENPEDHEEPDGDEKPMAKSVMALIEGEEVEAVDATEILKSLDARIGAHEDVLAKALESTLATIKNQGEMIKSLTTRVEKLSGKGVGRKTVLSVVEKPAADQTMAKSTQEGMTASEFMAKASAAFSAGKLTGHELTTADVALRSGERVPEAIVAKALA